MMQFFRGYYRMVSVFVYDDDRYYELRPEFSWRCLGIFIRKIQFQLVSAKKMLPVANSIASAFGRFVSGSLKKGVEVYVLTPKRRKGIHVVMVMNGRIRKKHCGILYAFMHEELLRRLRVREIERVLSR